MRTLVTISIIFTTLWSNILLAQISILAEPQISFAKENRSHSYYVEQAELWWKEIEKDKTSENNWYNYYRACRNAQGTANWRTDFVDESPCLRLGKDIVELMADNIPDTFAYNFVKGSTGGVSPEGGKYLLKAYKMNPDFEGLLSDVITYATSTHNPELRKEANERWFLNNGISSGFLTFGYNLLNSVEPNSILLTEHDNDTYPVWMLQDAKQIRKDVIVLNIDFFLYGGYREKIFKELGIKPFKLDHIDINEYETNWENVVKHFLNHYQGSRPLYISKTVSSKWYTGFENSLYTSGLALKFSQNPINLREKNIDLVEDSFLLDTLRIELTNDISQNRINEMNLNYLESLKIAFDEYRKSDNLDNAEQVKQLAFIIIGRLEDHDNAKKYKSQFN